MHIGVSFKMYLDRSQTRAWCAAAAEIAKRREAICRHEVKLTLFPSLTAMEMALMACRDAPMSFGAQDLFWMDRGPYTGAISGMDLADMGCRYAEIGHAERRQVFGEDDSIIAKKVTAATRNGLIPWLCVGEPKPDTASAATAYCVAQLRSALANLATRTDLVVAYEPVWAIGQAKPASASHAAEVMDGIKAWLANRAILADTAVVYGGSASHGTLSALGDVADGLFLGRFAHDIDAFERIIDEATSHA